MRKLPEHSDRARWAAALLLIAACAPDLRQDHPFDGTLPDDGASRVSFEPGGEGITLTRVDATRKEAWVYLDLEGRREVPAQEAVGTAEWDLAFQRFKIITNSGVSGVGEVETAILPGADFAALAQAPPGGYQRDAADGSDSNADVDSAFLIGDGWYEYDLLAHKVAPREIVYVVHTPGGFYKLQLLSYYDEAGTGGRLSFEWSPVAAPPP